MMVELEENGRDSGVTFGIFTVKRELGVDINITPISAANKEIKQIKRNMMMYIS